MLLFYVREWFLDDLFCLVVITGMFFKGFESIERFAVIYTIPNMYVIVLCFMFSPSKAGVEELYKYQMFDANSEGEHREVHSGGEDDDIEIKMDVKVIEFTDQNIHKEEVEEEEVTDEL